MSVFQVSTNHPPDNEKDWTAFLNNIFQPGEKSCEQLVYELQIEFKSGGSPDVSNIKIDRVKFDAAKRTGRFRILLDVTFTFGCEDICTLKKDQTSEWSFEIDPSNQNIAFSNTLYPEGRSTADEF
ncbi:hypothetical protein [Mucilaginibacter sp. KACC 22063]|uniref:hypothetical protein n=1 Tax=Mucilaginibacter sp. KACC 22063 TaxID=3025666 RepID=UPI002366937C|nr:hypothetical protein [Mucilaginibacter sp. KACC 22063]WDF53824.1 hypothetical protein PQ461_12795 [Mucilaginibacter sp. KACC 22063]